MTIETTNNEVTPVQNIWMEYVTTHTPADIASKMLSLEESKTNYQNYLDTLRTKLNQAVDTVTEFIRDGLDEDGVDKDGLLELAANLDIELNKEIEVTLTVTITTTASVPYDFDEDNIDESDFDISCRIGSEYDFEYPEITIDDISIEENN